MQRVTQTQQIGVALKIVNTIANIQGDKKHNVVSKTNITGRKRFDDDSVANTIFKMQIEYRNIRFTRAIWKVRSMAS